MVIAPARGGGGGMDSNLRHVWDVMLYALNIMECPELPPISKKESELYEVKGQERLR